jgi:hypothetical protein
MTTSMSSTATSITTTSTTETAFVVSDNVTLGAASCVAIWDNCGGWWEDRKLPTQRCCGRAKCMFAKGQNMNEAKFWGGQMTCVDTILQAWEKSQDYAVDPLYRGQSSVGSSVSAPVETGKH